MLMFCVKGVFKLLLLARLKQEALRCCRLIETWQRNVNASWLASLDSSLAEGRGLHFAVCVMWSETCWRGKRRWWPCCHREPNVMGSRPPPWTWPPSDGLGTFSCPSSHHSPHLIHQYVSTEIGSIDGQVSHLIFSFRPKEMIGWLIQSCDSYR